MTRRLHPAPRPGGIYPTLRALIAPLALVSAAAHADVTVPQHDRPRGQPEQPPPPPPHPPRRLGGKPISPRPPEKLGMVLHPHAPHEPCHPIAVEELS